MKIGTILAVAALAVAGCGKKDEGTPAQSDAKPAPAPAPAHVPAAPVKAAPEPNHGELVAAVSAALATVMGTKVSGIRILSMKKVD